MYPTSTSQRQVFAKNRLNQDIYTIDDEGNVTGDAIHVE